LSLEFEVILYKTIELEIQIKLAKLK